MARKNRRRRASSQRPAYRSERYSIRALHEDREYGMYWYAWLWKLVRPVLIFLCSALIVIGMVTVGYNRIYDMLLAPVSDSGEVVTFQIENGDSATRIGYNLEQANLLRDSRVFRYLVQLQGLTNKLSYGTFKLSPSMNVNQIIAELTSGSQTNERVITIVPGWTVDDIAQYLVSIGALENTTDFTDLCNNVDMYVGSSYALRDAQNHDALQGRKYALEGYLAPDTYRVFVSATADSIIRTLLNQDNTILDRVFYEDHTEYYADDEGNFHEVETYKTDLSMDQIVTLASIIEKEAGNRDDYRRVAAVFYNRMAAGMRLDSDPTATYLSGESKLALTEAETSDPNAYNTYVVDGLPAGPICNPSLAALEAAMQPDMDYIHENYLYFCATEPTSGKLAFSKTLEEHEANVALYRPLWEEYDRQRAAEKQAQEAQAEALRQAAEQASAN